MVKKIVISLVSISLICSGYLFSQNNGKISGSVKDIDTDEPLVSANVMIKGTYIGASTDTKGYFYIKKVPAGTCEVIVSIIGYRTETRSGIEVIEGATTEVNFEMKSEPIKMDKVTVTATRGNNLVTDVPVSTWIITDADLRRGTSQNIGEALQSAGGVYIKNYGDIAAQKTISIRGSTDSQVLVLLDGQRLNNSQNSTVDFSWIPVDDVQKIEIVKGGHSAVYGTNAVGGVVNIITKSPIHGQKFSSSIRSSIGPQATRIYSVNGSQEIGKLSYYISLKQVKGDGDYKFKDNLGVEKRLENNDLKSDNMFFKLNYNLFKNLNITLSTQHNEIKKGLPGSISYPNPNGRMNETINLHNLSFDGNILTRLHLRANAYYHRTDDRIDNPDPWTPFSRHKNQASGFELQNRYILNKTIALTYGYDYRHDKVSSTEVHGQERNTHGLYLQAESESRINYLPLINKISFIPAVRYDSYSDIGNEISPKLGLALSRIGSLTTSFRGNIGKSFRSPTFNDLYWPEDFWSAGNPDLKPEAGINYDAGTILEYTTDNFSTNLEFTYFTSNLEDLIIWAPRSDGKWTPQNVDESKTRGAETKIEFNLFDPLINFNVAHTYMLAKNNSDDSPDKGKFLIYRPKHKFDVGLGFEYHLLQLSLMYRYVDKSFTTSDNKESTPAYHVFDVSASAIPSIFGIEVLAKFDILNIFDKRFFVIDDYPMPGRQVRFTLGLQY